MTEQEDSRQKSRRDLLLVLLILPLGVLCMFMTGQVAIRLAPEWVMNADMRSLLDPNATFAAQGIQPFIEPLNPGILTRPAWGDLFLTPHALIPTRVIITATPPPPPARTPPPPVLITPDSKPEPTATLSGPIIIPTRDQPLQADLRIEKSDNSRTYTPGASINYTILVTNLGPDGAPRLEIVDNLPSVITGITANCTPSNLCGTNTSSGNRVSYSGAVLPYNAVITISINGTVAANATGDLVNTASVALSGNIRAFDPIPDNNTATDRDIRLSVHDLAVTKNDGFTTYTANSPINYTIVVSNNGPSNARGITITDNIPVPVAAWTWECTTVVNAGNCDGVTNSTSNFRDTVNIQSGGRIEYTVTANPRGTLQDIVNTVAVTLPAGSEFVDPDLSNNSATDIDIPYIDLQITKVDGGNSYSAGGSIPYTVTVTNNSTFNLTGISVSDNKPAEVTTWSWACAGGCTPVSNSNSNFTDTINLAAGASLVYDVTAMVSASAGLGEITNTATVGVPVGLVDANMANNSATETTPLHIDLQIMKTNGVNTYTPNGTLNYTLIVTNNSAIALNGVTVTDTIPVLIDPSTWTWTCAPAPGSPGGSCAAPNGTGNINHTVNLPAGASVIFEISARVYGNAAGNLVNTASVSPPDGYQDAAPGNNTATDIDSNASGEPDIGPPDGGIISPLAGTTTTYFFSPGISSNGSSTPDFVFYEYYRSDIPGIAMDRVVILLSQDGNSWTQVFYWGDESPDTNTKVYLAIHALCGGSERDGCNIPASPTYLYQSNGYYSGIEIDIDSLGLTGSYPWIRFYCPLASEGNMDGSCDIDSIQPYYP